MSPPLITQAHTVPVVGRDDHLPALGPQQLTLARVQAQLQNQEGWRPALGGDGGAGGAGNAAATAAISRKAAAVLVPLVQHETELRVLLTQRTAHLRSHAGQISFPGGRAEEGDAGPAETALREAQEEVGLQPQQIRVLGLMPAYFTVTAFDVTPVVAVVQPPLGIKPDRHEVDDVFEVPLSFLMNPAHHRRHRFESGGTVRHFLSMPWEGVGLSGQQREFFIWGATAAMLRNLYHLLAR